MADSIATTRRAIDMCVDANYCRRLHHHVARAPPAYSGLAGGCDRCGQRARLSRSGNAGMSSPPAVGVVIRDEHMLILRAGV